VVERLADGQVVRWQGDLIYETRRYATGVLTERGLFLNSATSARDTEHTELQLAFIRERVKGARWQPLGLLRFISFFIWGVFEHTAWLQLADDTSKRLFFRTEGEARDFCSAVNEWVES
jgi:hypothetical protein